LERQRVLPRPHRRSRGLPEGADGCPGLRALLDRRVHRDADADADADHDFSDAHADNHVSGAH
jgi:hypothetical protein